MTTRTVISAALACLVAIAGTAAAGAAVHVEPVLAGLSSPVCS